MRLKRCRNAHLPHDGCEQPPLHRGAAKRDDDVIRACPGRQEARDLDPGGFGLAALAGAGEEREPAVERVDRFGVAFENVPGDVSERSAGRVGRVELEFRNHGTALLLKARQQARARRERVAVREVDRKRDRAHTCENRDQAQLHLRQVVEAVDEHRCIAPGVWLGLKRGDSGSRDRSSVGAPGAVAQALVLGIEAGELPLLRGVPVGRVGGTKEVGGGDERALELGDQGVQRRREAWRRGRAAEHAQVRRGDGGPYERQALGRREARRHRGGGEAGNLVEQGAERADRGSHLGAAVRAQVPLETHDVVARRNDEDGIAVKRFAQACEHRACAVRVRRPDDQFERHYLFLSSAVTLSDPRSARGGLI